jgi:hypothetical protein
MLGLVLLTSSPTWAQSWADAPADLTVSEYLQLVFDLNMRRPESEALNSFSLLGFYPSSDPQSALVLVIQPWCDQRVPPQDLRQEIRKVGEALSDQFEAMARHPRVLKRWKMNNPKANIVVRHVRFSDLRETLAVTVRGQTLFDDNGISKAKAEIMRRGAIWSW